MRIDREELAWAGGLFEGEGCFTGKEKGRHYQVTAKVRMTDRDPLERFVRAVGVGEVKGPFEHHSGHGRKPFYSWAVQSFEHFQAVVAMLWPFLGERRKARALELLRTRKNHQPAHHFRHLSA